MPYRDWVTNRYLRITEGNFTLTSTIGNDVVAVLKNRGAAEPAIQVLADYLDPLNAYFQQKFAQLDATSGTAWGLSRHLLLILPSIHNYHAHQ